MSVDNYPVSDVGTEKADCRMGLEKELAGQSPTPSDLTALIDELQHLSAKPEMNWFIMGRRFYRIIHERLYKIAGYRSFD